MKIVAIASDHAGFSLKSFLIEEIKNLGYEVLDLGTSSTESVDYPDFAAALTKTITTGKAAVGVAVCATGIGISIAANRNPKIRAALCCNAEAASLARRHNDANILALGAKMLSEDVAKECLRVFLSTPFDGGRHEVRVNKLNNGSF